MLELRDATYRYPGYANPVLHDVNLRVADGEIVGLVGPNEAGKSTLCLVASGLAPASIGGKLTGSLTIDGEPMADRKAHELAERVVVCFQNPNTQRSGITATVFEEIALGPMNLGLTVPEVVERTREALALLRLEQIVDRDPARLSGGQAQLVGIAGLLAMRPSHVILDEPTAQLDPAGTRLVGEALVALASRGSSLLIAEHKTDLLQRLSHEVAVLVDGSVAAHAVADELLVDRRLDGWGIEPPSSVRIARAAEEAGAAVPELTP